MTKQLPKKILRIERNFFVSLRKKCFWPPTPRRRRFFLTGGAPPPPTEIYRRAPADTMTSAHSSNADPFFFCGWSNNLEWTSNRSKAPLKRYFFSIPPPSQESRLLISYWPGSGAPLSRYLEAALYKF